MILIQRRWWRVAMERAQTSRWLHVHGAAGSGKSVFAKWLVEELRAQGFEARLVDMTAPPPSPGAPPDDLGVAIPDLSPAPEPEERSFWRMRPTSPPASGRFFLILDGVDALLGSRIGFERMVEAFARFAGETDLRFQVVTTGVLPVEATASFLQDGKPEGMEGFEEMSAAWFDPDDDDDLEEIEKAFPQADKQLLTLGVVEADGNPDLLLRLLRQGLKAVESLGRARLAIQKAKQEVRSDHSLILRFFSWLSSPPCASLTARVHILALEYMLGQAEPRRMREAAAFARALGLLHPIRSLVESSTAEAPIEDVGRLPLYLGDWILPDLSKDLTARIDDLKARHLERLEAAEAHAAGLRDEALQAVLEFVRREFCDSDRGRARSTEIDSGSEATIIRGRMYALRLKWRHEDYHDTSDPSPAGSLRAPKHYVYSALRVFYGLPQGIRDAWQREFSMLLEVSNAGHASMPDIRQSATLVDHTGDGESFGFILIEDEGEKWHDRVYAYFRRPENRRHAFAQASSLIGGLVRLQARGLAHRLITPDTLRCREDANGDYTLLYGGFDIATGAYFSSMTQGGSSSRALSAVVMNALVPSRARRRFFEPSAQPIFYEPDSEYRTEVVMPQSDVYGLCMSLCELFYGPPPDAALEEFVQAPSSSEAGEALVRLLAAYREHILKDTTNIVSEALRDIILSGIEAETHDRPTAMDLQKALLDNARRLAEDYVHIAQSAYILSYNSRNMLNELSRNLHHILDFDPKDLATAPHELHRFLEARLRRADAIFRDPDGFSRYIANERRTERHSTAKIVISCDGVSFYCELARSPSNHDYGGRLLELRYTLDRRNHALSDLVAPRQRIDFPCDSFILLPHDDASIIANQLETRIRDEKVQLGKWTEYWSGLLEASVPKDLQTAYDSMIFVTEAIWNQRRLIHFPVTARRNRHGSTDVTIELNKAAFHARIDRDPYLALLYSEEPQNAEVFFQTALLDWLDRSGSADDAISFVLDGGDQRMRLSVRPTDVQLGRIWAPDAPRDLEGSGHLVFSDDRGVEALYRTQLSMLAEMRTNMCVLEQLQRPRPTMSLSRQPPKDFGDNLKGRAAETIWSMVNAHPLFMLQGPPGTGKTRALSEFIRHVLVHEDVTAKFLITAQSHASVDTTLMRIADIMQRQDGEGGAFHIIRHFSASTEQNVSKEVVEAYSVPHQVQAIAKRMHGNAQDAMRQLNLEAGPSSAGPAKRELAAKLQRWGLDLLANARTEAYDELERRFRRNASLHFSTTSTASREADQVLDPEQKFHTAVIEEAATAWGTDLIQPMLKARASILIGDHRQIGPFDSLRLLRLARRACGAAPDEGEIHVESEKSLAIFPQYAADPEAFTQWMEPFRRIFTQMERKSISRIQGGVKVADMLDTQFRSVRPIGQMVSQAFYAGEVAWGGVEFNPEKTALDFNKFSNLQLFQDVKVKDQALVWLDTSRLGAGYAQKRNLMGRMENAGERQILMALLRHLRTNTSPIAGEEGRFPDQPPLHEQLMILAPYRSQVDALKRNLGEDPARYGFSPFLEKAFAQIGAVTKTIDSAQGAEASTVIVSLVRAPLSEDRLSPVYGADPSAWARALRANYGFLTRRERINVMLSRARQQLVIIGDFDFFSDFVGQVEGWRSALGGYGSPGARMIDEEYGFWERLITYLEPFVVQLNLRKGGVFD